jgi:GAF domain-containing protein
MSIRTTATNCVYGGAIGRRRLGQLPPRTNTTCQSRLQRDKEPQDCCVTSTVAYGGTILRSRCNSISSLRTTRRCCTSSSSSSSANTNTNTNTANSIVSHTEGVEIEAQLRQLIQQQGSCVMGWTQRMDAQQKEKLLDVLRTATGNNPPRMSSSSSVSSSVSSTVATSTTLDTPTTVTNPTKNSATAHNNNTTTTTTTATTVTDTAVPEPTLRELRMVTLNMAIPFVGFGIMDNSILILAGDMIDTSLGVALGISTMCAAAIGNIISDIAGLLLGTFIEDFCANYLRLPVPNLTTAQRQLRSVRFASQWGCGIGVTIGCIIGMFPLLFIDSHKVQAKKREAHLDAIFRDVVTEAASLVGAARTCLYLLVSPDDKDNNIKKTSSTSLMPVADGKWLVNKYYDKASAPKGASAQERWIPLGRGIISRAVLTGETLNISEVTLEPDYVPEYAVEPGALNSNATVTRSMICIPVMDSAGRPIAVIQAINKVGKGREDDDDDDGEPALVIPGLLSSSLEGPRSFTDNDVQILKALASHVSVSLQRMYEQADGDEAEMRLKDTIQMLKKYGLAGLDDEQQQYSSSSSSRTKLARRPLFPDDVPYAT